MIPPGIDRARLLRKLETARYELKGMDTPSFAVPSREGHDDYPISLAFGPMSPRPPRRGEDWARVW